MMLQHERGYYSPRWADEPTVRGRRIVEAETLSAERKAELRDATRRARAERDAQARYRAQRDARLAASRWWCRMCRSWVTYPHTRAGCLATVPNDHGNTVQLVGLLRAIDTARELHGG